MRVPIQIVECATSRPVEAELFDEVTVEHFLETQKEWRPVVLACSQTVGPERCTGPDCSPPLPLGLEFQGRGTASSRLFIFWDHVQRKAPGLDEARSNRPGRTASFPKRETGRLRGLLGDGSLEHQGADAGSWKRSAICCCRNETNRSCRAKEHRRRIPTKLPSPCINPCVPRDAGPYCW